MEALDSPPRRAFETVAHSDVKTVLHVHLKRKEEEQEEGEEGEEEEEEEEEE